MMSKCPICSGNLVVTPVPTDKMNHLFDRHMEELYGPQMHETCTVCGEGFWISRVDVEHEDVHGHRHPTRGEV